MLRVARLFRAMALFLCALLGLVFCGDTAHAQEQRSPQSEQPERQAATDARNPQTTTTNTPDTLTAVPNRPTFATTAETVQRGVFEIEYGLEAADAHQNINGLLKWGVLENLELRFANNPIQRNSDVTGTGDSGTGFEYQAFRQKKKLPTFS